MSEDDVKTSLNMVRINTGLDVNDTEDNFKLHFIMIAKKSLKTRENQEESLIHQKFLLLSANGMNSGV